MRYTWYGDATLDGSVRLADFNRLAADFGNTGTTWYQGNFNYDNVTNLADFNLLSANFGKEGLGPGDDEDGFNEYTYEDLLEMLLGGGGS